MFRYKNILFFKIGIAFEHRYKIETIAFVTICSIFS